MSLNAWSARHSKELLRAFRACPSLVERSPERDALWLVVRAAICTRSAADITPYGSAAHVVVTEDNASEELIAAMAWLYEHEIRARTLGSEQLLLALRAVATRGGDGSGRSAQADGLHGMTGVPAGLGVLFWPIDGAGVA